MSSRQRIFKVEAASLRATRPTRSPGRPRTRLNRYLLPQRVGELGGEHLPGGAPRGRPILVIGDDDFARETLVDLLELAGFRALAGQGVQSLADLAEMERPGLVLVDLCPWESWPFGWQDGSLAGVPVIVLSTGELEDLEAEGIVGHFKKPVVVQKLLAAVRRYCHR